MMADNEMAMDGGIASLNCLHLESLRSAQADYAFIRGNASTDLLQETGARRGVGMELLDALRTMKEMGGESEELNRVINAVGITVSTIQLGYGAYSILRGLIMMRTGKATSEFTALATALQSIPGYGQWVVGLAVTAGATAVGAFAIGERIGESQAETVTINLPAVDLSNPTARRAVASTAGGLV